MIIYAGDNGIYPIFYKNLYLINTKLNILYFNNLNEIPMFITDNYYCVCIVFKLTKKKILQVLNHHTDKIIFLLVSQSEDENILLKSLLNSNEKIILHFNNIFNLETFFSIRDYKTDFKYKFWIDILHKDNFTLFDFFYISKINHMEKNFNFDFLYFVNLISFSFIIFQKNKDYFSFKNNFPKISKINFYFAWLLIKNINVYKMNKLIQLSNKINLHLTLQ